MATAHFHQYCQRKSSSPSNGAWRAKLVLGLSIFSVGCWEEIRYDASNEPPAPQPTLQERAAAEDVHQESTATAATLFAEEQQEPSVQDRGASKPVVEGTAIEPDDPLTVALEVHEQRAAVDAPPAAPAELDWLDDSPEPPTVERVEDVAPVAPARTSIATWRMSSKWSLAAAYFAKGQGPDRYSESLELANYAARLLEVSLPELPEGVSDAERQRATVSFLIDDAGRQLVDQIGKHYGADQAALAELAIKSHALLLIYNPRNKELAPIVSAIDEAAKNSGLPENVWRELVDLLEQRAAFTSVKQAVFQLHQRVPVELADSRGE